MANTQGNSLKKLLDLPRTPENAEAMQGIENSFKALTEVDNTVSELQSKIMDRLKTLQNLLHANKKIIKTKTPVVKQLNELLNDGKDADNKDEERNVSDKDSSSAIASASALDEGKMSESKKSN